MITWKYDFNEENIWVFIFKHFLSFKHDRKMMRIQEGFEFWVKIEFCMIEQTVARHHLEISRQWSAHIAHMKGWWSATLCWQLHPSQESWNFHRDEKARPRFHPIMWDTSQSLTFNLTFAFNSIAHTSRLPLLLRGKHSTRVKTLELREKKEGTVKRVHSSRKREKREGKFKSC